MEKTETDGNVDSIEMAKQLRERNTPLMLKKAAVYPGETLVSVLITNVVPLVYSRGVSGASDGVSVCAERVRDLEVRLIVCVSDVCVPSSN